MGYHLFRLHLLWGQEQALGGMLGAGGVDVSWVPSFAAPGWNLLIHRCSTAEEDGEEERAEGTKYLAIPFLL